MWGDSAIASNVPQLGNEIGLPITGVATEPPFAPSITAVARLPHNHQCAKSFFGQSFDTLQGARGVFTDADKEQIEPSQASCKRSSADHDPPRRVALVEQPSTTLTRT